MMSIDEQVECERAVLTSPAFHAALKKQYGDIDPSLAMVDIWSAGNYAADRVPNQRTDIQPLTITQPNGPSFTVDGNSIAWQNWKFVVGFSAREGLTLHHIRYADRSILYRASLSPSRFPARGRVISKYLRTSSQRVSRS